MKITALEVEGYGVWTGLKLDGLSDGLNVFFGPNEAGKTTLMQFVRSVLYGFSPERRRYLPPLHGGLPGGRLELAGPGGRFEVGRRAGSDGAADELIVVGVDGARHGEHVLRSLLAGVDEPIFNNVFAVGLQELQELSTLNDTEAAALLYNLSAGLDRVSLVEVMRELQGSRNRLLDAAGGPSQIAQLVAERDKLRAEIEGLHELTRRYVRLAAERGQVDREAARLADEASQLAHQCRVLEIALALRDRWRERQSLDEQLAALGPIEKVPDGALERLDAIQAALNEHQERSDELRRRRAALRAEAERLRVNEPLWRLAPRIEALAEQEQWIGTLETRIFELETEIAEAESRLAAEQERFGVSGEFPAVSPRSLAALRRPAAAMRRARQRLQDAQREVSGNRDNARSLSEQVQAALSARGERDLREATERLSGLVSQLRRRAQIDERLAQLARHQAELDAEDHALVDRQLLPVWALVGLGALFVAGAVLLLFSLAGALISSPLLASAGWPTAVLGLAAVGGAIFTKLHLERSAARRARDCREQLKLLQMQIKQAKEERESLDRQLPRGGGPVAAGLEAAERELAELEEAVPLDARRQAAEEEAQAAAGRARDAEEDLAAAQRRWNEAVAAAGLPRKLSPKQVRQLAACAEQVKEIQQRLARRREEHAERVKELEGLKARIAQLVKDTRLGVENRPAAEQLRALVEQLADQESRIQRRQAIRHEARQIRKKRVRLENAIERLSNQRRLLLEEAGAAEETEFRRRAAEHARMRDLSARRDAVQREIEAAIAGCCSEEALREQLESDAAAGIESRRQQLQKRLEACQTQARQRFEKRGQLNEQIRVLAENRAPAVTALELALVEKRLDEAVRRWQVLAVTHQVLESVRKGYEATRQPETLREASGYLERMTQGRYLRVWTPLADDVLLVDDAEGKPHGVEALSRGLREQLFLSLRLALVASYARRGAPLPVLLDDVLVNFDSRRAKAAATVLCDFAGAGHQLLVFTCHDHIAEMFQALEVEVHRLPRHGRLAPDAVPTSKRPVKRKRRAADRPQEVAAAAAPPQPGRGEYAAEADLAPQEVEPFAPWEEESDPSDEPPETSDPDDQSLEIREFDDDAEAA